MTARRLKRLSIHWRGIEPRLTSERGQTVLSRDRPLAGRRIPFFAFLSGAAQRFPSGSRVSAGLADQLQSLPPALASSRRLVALVSTLILVALVPTIFFGSLFWLGMIQMPQSDPARPKPAPTIPVAIPRPVLSSPILLEARAGESVAWPIALDGTDGVPARSIIAIRGLPRDSTLSSGHPNGESEWNVETDDIGDLQIALPDSASGIAKLIVQLVANDGSIIAETATVLNAKSNIEANSVDANVSSQAGHALVAGETGREPEIAANAVGAASHRDPVPLPSRRPTPVKHLDDGAAWVMPSTFVNLREKPSPSSRVVSIVPKGAKLRVIVRKKRWVQVTNPATSDKGWIYSPKPK